VAEAAANALAYGDERRFPLRIPTALLALPVPVAVVVTAAGIAAGPLLLADGRTGAGIVITLIGWPVAVLVVRSLHTLARRWLVLVPAGMTFVDPLTLAEPALVRRAGIVGVRPAPATPAPEGALDLRLGSLLGGVAVDLGEPAELARRRGRAGAQRVATRSVLVAVVRRAALLDQARARRLTPR
jgi:hypothetical protein